jgi:hypothetical protein
MTVLDNSLQGFIDLELIAENEKREKKHEPSGLLSASMLYQPLRFQVMKTIGIPRKSFEPYLLGKFKRGNDCEDWLADRMDKAGILIERQKEIKYKNVIGFIDALVDSGKMNFKKGQMPHEIKSVTNAKLKRISQTEVDYHYKLQGGLYALAIGSEYYAIDIISAEDLRVNTYIFDVKDIKSDIENIISRYDEAMENWKTKKILPKFEVNPKVPWTSNLEYAPFSMEFVEMTDSDMVKYIDNNGKSANI